MLSFFDTNKPFVVFPLFLLSLLLHLRLFFDGVALAETDAQAPIALSLLSILDLKNGVPPWLVFFISSTVLFLGAIVFNQLFNESKFIDKQSHLPAYFYILVGSYYSEFLQLQPMLFANILFLLAINQMFTAFNPGTAFKEIFNCSFLIAIASLFYFPFLLLIVAIPIILFILRGFNWREWVIALLGVITPFYILFSYYYLSGQFLSSLNFKLIPKVKTISEIISQMGWLDYTQSAVIIILLIISLFTIQSNYLSSHIKTRKFFNSFYWLLAFCFIAALAEFPPDLQQFMILTVPLSFAFTYLIMSMENNLWARLINVILLLMIALGQYFNLIIK